MSFPRYPKYKDSGVEWLGQVPEHWEIMALKHLASLRSGETITADSINESGEYPVFGGNGLRGYTSAFTHDGLYALIGRQGALCGNINYAEGKFWASEHAVVVSPKTQVVSKWFGELLRAMDLNQYSVSAAQPGLSVEIISNLRIPVPLCSEQTAIAAFLDQETAKIDELVTEQKKLMELLKEKRQAVISHAVTKGLNPNAPMKPSGIEWLGDVPKHWEVTRLANVFREVAEPGTDELPILSVSIHHGVSDKEVEEEDMDRKVTRSDDRSKYKRVAPGDLVYNMMRAWQGGFGAVTVEGMVSPAYVVARPQVLLETTFIEKLLRTPQAIEQMRRHSQGVTDFRLRLYWDEFKNIGVALPPQAEALNICARIAEMEEKFSAMSAACAESIVLLQERRTALISAAVTGQIDVRPLIAKEPSHERA
jgi:type I restriction enzyme S subunit